MTRSAVPGRAWLSMLSGKLPRAWRWGLLVLLITGCGVLLGIRLLATHQVGRHPLSALRFALGQHDIARQQQQLYQAVTVALREAGLETNAYMREDLQVQRRGRESWVVRRHRLVLPVEVSLQSVETRLTNVLRQVPHSILARRTRQQKTVVSVALTTGIDGAAADIFVLTQTRAIASPMARTAALSPSDAVLQPPLARVAIVIDDMGWDLPMAQALLALNAPLSFAIIPRSPYQYETVEAVQQHGRDILLHLPMEPHGYPRVNPGEQALLSDMTSSELTTRLQVALQELPMAVGVNNHMGSRLTEDSQVMRVVMHELQQRGLFFLDSRTSSHSQAFQVAREMGVRAGQRQVFLDHDGQPEQISHRLHQLLSLARKRGRAIGIGHPRMETLHALQQLIPELHAAGIEIVPVSHLVD
ncbi:MAG: divergent polysaccharide deacetylase family protein [Candidatus Tectomicrobia bacterium]|nr:divergent polysaccharide deacetylase family protein [Candidatus Tectomicrobia bacterium]